MEARKEMVNTSFLARKAFLKSQAGHCYAAVYSLGGRYNTPHGLANTAKEGNPLYYIPKLWSAKESEQLYYSVMEREGLAKNN